MVPVFWSIKAKGQFFRMILQEPTKKGIAAFLFLLFSQLGLFAQSPGSADYIKVSWHLPNIIKDSSDLYAQVAIKNTSDSVTEVYKELMVGLFNNIFDDNIVNFEIYVEKKTRNGFRSHPGSFVDPIDQSNTNVSLARTTLRPHDSIVLFFHIDSRHTFEIGAYRIKCRYWNNVRKNTSIESPWTYFRVIKPIYARRCFEDNQ